MLWLEQGNGLLTRNLCLSCKVEIKAPAVQGYYRACMDITKCRRRGSNCASRFFPQRRAFSLATSGHLAFSTKSVPRRKSLNVDQRVEDKLDFEHWNQRGYVTVFMFKHRRSKRIHTGTHLSIRLAKDCGALWSSPPFMLIFPQKVWRRVVSC